MSPLLATALTLAAIAVLFWPEVREEQPGVSRGTWVVFIWFFFVGTRLPSQWLRANIGLEVGLYNTTEGSPLDGGIYLTLQLIALYVLYMRRVDWGSFFRKNAWIALYFALGLASILWSDYPFVALKRIVKASQNAIMALVVLTEERPEKAIGAVLRWFVFLFVPLSFLLTRYYPDLGRMYHMGQPFAMGAASGKNGLGQSTMVCMTGLAWLLLVDRQWKGEAGRGLRVAEFLLLAGVCVWLMSMADSATSLVCIVVVVALFVAARVLGVYRQPNRIMTVSLFAGALLIGLEFIFGWSQFVIVGMLGRDPSLTTRVPMWMELLGMSQRPILGTGYESFWLGDRLAALYGEWGTFNAHNGYLETYLNLGGVGLLLIVMGTARGLRSNIGPQLQEGRPLAVLKLACVISAVIYNWTEAALHGTNITWMLMLFGLLDIKVREPGTERVRAMTFV